MSEERFRYIPVSERLPSHTDKVIARYKNGHQVQAIYRADKWEILLDKKLPGKITHWIELEDLKAWLKHEGMLNE